MDYSTKFRLFEVMRRVTIRLLFITYYRKVGEFVFCRHITFRVKQVINFTSCILFTHKLMIKITHWLQVTVHISLNNQTIRHVLVINSKIQMTD